MVDSESLSPQSGGEDEGIIETEEDIDNEETQEGKKDGEDTDEDASASESQDTDESSDEDDTSEKTEEDEEVSDDSPEGDEIDKELEEGGEKVLGALREQYDKIKTDIIEARKERREAREETKEQPLIVPKDSTLSKEDIAKALPDVNPDDVATIQKVVEKLGYVKKDVLQSELSTTTWRGAIKANQNVWLDAHPEYKPDHDTDDKNWNALQGVLKDHSLSLPSDPAKLNKLLDFAHSVVKPTPISLPKKSRAAIEASRAKVKSAGEGAKAGGKQPVEKKGVSQLAKENVSGFDDAEMDELFG